MLQKMFEICKSKCIAIKAVMVMDVQYTPNCNNVIIEKSKM